MKLKDIRPDHLNSLYSQLAQPGAGAGSAHASAKVDVAVLLKEKHLTRQGLADMSGISIKAVYAAVKGERVSKEAAEAISDALGNKLDKLFSVEEAGRTLSAKTIREYHRLIHTVLDQAIKEGLVAVNVADRATPPKVEQKDVNYFQLEQVTAIREALEQEPVKWKTLVHLLLITGARRGEILGLKWEKVDFNSNRVYICNNILYSADIGIYEDTPKTERSKRYVSLPAETMQLLRQYRVWQNTERLRLGGYYQDQGFVFAQDNGGPMHPDSVTTWLARFSKRHGLPHVNAHAFRHTMASMLYFNGVDSVSISKRLGHAQVSTTANIYAHVMEEADQRNADILSEVFLKKTASNS
ncbi:MAG TPA: tyrosine-type recombinase/integrase [Candidatus Flavonifractor intestinipullorum]|uniref:Tyrosine-type recombinase/integrase n=1 Tax=Candidatus Flavonifractor intestinipullorum TaxID=2838587 RepID=A0A9D2MB37_9FIRM|nr:tyrosine-type recombinase/integrase [Candidatus Flavonifractor intestinipullorum]